MTSLIVVDAQRARGSFDEHIGYRDLARYLFSRIGAGVLCILLKLFSGLDNYRRGYRCNQN
jgi:hypothetical protein